MTLNEVMGKGGKGLPWDLLANHICVVTCINLEATVVGPKVN